MFGWGMTTSPHPQQVLDLFQRIVGNDPKLGLLTHEGPAFSRRRIYSLSVVIWLMLLQRLLPKFTLGSAVQQLVHSRATHGFFGAARRISLSAGAYCRARQKLPTMVATQVFDLLADRLLGWLPRNPVLTDRAIFVVDGSTLSLPHTPELLKAFPPGRNQHGRSHWPLLRLVVLQDAQTGLALRPAWGPQAVSEQALAFQVIAHLPPGALLIGDRNFGVFGVAWAAHQRAHPVLLRLTSARALKLAKGPLSACQDRPIIWKPTRFDLCGGPHPEQAQLAGRLVCCPSLDPSAPEPLYFFTTADYPARQISQLYALRWNVEADLRSIKQAVHLKQLSARSVATLEKELLLALAAYNLVRAVICLAAEQAEVPPRRLSFTNVFTLVETFSGDILAARNQADWDACWRRIISLAAQYLLPHRSKRRSFPRAVWPRQNPFPANHSA